MYIVEGYLEIEIEGSQTLAMYCGVLGALGIGHHCQSVAKV